MTELPKKENFPPNSDKKLEPIAKGTVRQPSVASKTVGAIFAEDAKSVGAYVLTDIVVPTVKQIISDVVTGGIERALYGGNAPVRRGATSSYSPRVNFTNYGAAHRPDRSRSTSSQHSSRVDFGSIELPTRADAVSVLDKLRDLIEYDQSATVIDACTLVGVSHSYTDNDWGWRSLRDADIRAGRDADGNQCYILSLPKPEYLK